MLKKGTEKPHRVQVTISLTLIRFDCSILLSNHLTQMSIKLNDLVSIVKLWCCGRGEGLVLYWWGVKREKSDLIN